jgi:excisionase family DNA binding protein
LAEEYDLRNNERITPRTIALYCQVSKSTVLEWIRSGKLKAFNLPSGHYRINIADFRDFLEWYDMPVNGELFEPEYKGNEVI